ncbi:hypothetical protein S2091_2698 [Solimicrobium silvestre]|uniref:Helix-turn-helix protein n=2 Tax=Solimicrobium silvestre TaxID=2099400 RepID=A0A2S9GY49_9BURK|nr:hypothetical protein S2091_2698 [Solimicrobium silvestre]
MLSILNIRFMNIQKTISLIKSAGLTQSQIAKFVGCSAPNISDLANGVHGQVRPSSKVVDGLRKLLSEHGLQEILDP